MAISSFKDIIDNKGYRISEKDRKIFEENNIQSFFGLSDDDYIEFIVYDMSDNQLPLIVGKNGKTSLVRYIPLNSDNINDYFLINEGSLIESGQFPTEYFIDVRRLLNESGYNIGLFKVQISFYNKRVGSYSDDSYSKLWIKQISPSRTEIKLLPINTSNVNLQDLQKRFLIMYSGGEFRSDNISNVSKFINSLSFTNAELFLKQKYGESWFNEFINNFSITNFDLFITNVYNALIESSYYEFSNRISNIIDINYGHPKDTDTDIELSKQEIKDSILLLLKQSINYYLPDGGVQTDRILVINRISEFIENQFKDIDSIFNTSKYLTHTLNFGDGNSYVISNWTGIKSGITDTLVLKLYNPLPKNIQPNTQVWISKIESIPIIQTVSLIGDIKNSIIPIQGPDFSLFDEGTGYEIYNTLLASGSNSSDNLINNYINISGIDTDKLNIPYVSGSVYNFNEFVHFGSSEERIKNFVYKINLIESYETEISSVLNTDIKLSYNGYLVNSSSLERIDISTLSDNPNTFVNVNNIISNFTNLTKNFDGFEKYLYYQSSSLAYPKNNITLYDYNSADVTDWYNYGVQLASNYDKFNVNYIINNIPQYLTENTDNQDYLLFLDMIGQHFDIIWVYINAINKSKKLENKVDTGVSNDMIYHMLESFGWESEFPFESNHLWEYAFGINQDGSNKYQQSLKSANQEVWRRILNNLPYLLKHKGTERSLKSIMASYGVPQSLLSVIEYGGPATTDNDNTISFSYADKSHVLQFNGDQSLNIKWDTVSGEYPNTIEMNIKFDENKDHQILNVDNNWQLTAVNTVGEFGKIKFSVSASSAVQEFETNQIKLFTDTYKTITLTRDKGAVSSSFNLYVKEPINDRLRLDESIQFDILNTNTYNESGVLNIGSTLVGSLDEFRLWSVPLDNSVITNHTKIPDAINGNSYTGSTSDLLVRFDFEYPKNRNSISGDSDIINVSLNDTYGLPTGSLSNFESITEYPYNYNTVERIVTADIPSIGYTYRDKIRFEEQELVSDLSYKVRATKKSFDRSAIDSPKIGLFFSLNKELNLDIIKSIGNIHIDNYIGDYDSLYEYEYKDLKKLRDYYFERIDRNVNEYIQLVKTVDKSLFETLKKLLPARAKVSSGLLIEPHILERNKIKWNKAEAENVSYLAEIDSNLIQFDGDIPIYNLIIDGYSDIIVNGLISNLETNIDIPEGNSLDGIRYTTLSDYVSAGTANIINTDFGIYVSERSTFGTPKAPSTVVTSMDIYGNILSSRFDVYRVKEKYNEKVLIQTEGWPATSDYEIVKYEYSDIERIKYKTTLVPYGESAPTVGDNILEVTPVNGYTKLHYKYSVYVPEGLKRSYNNGSVQTENTTPDGLPAVEIFQTNPNVIKVANTSRKAGDQILSTM